MWNVQISNVTEIDLECTTFCNLKCPECNRTTDKELISPILNTTHITLEDCNDFEITVKRGEYDLLNMSQELQFNYELLGSAERGVDYVDPIPPVITIPSNQESVKGPPLMSIEI